jgi:hypothetical protein
LLALRSAESGTIDVYALGEHNHPIMPEGMRLTFVNNWYWEGVPFFVPRETLFVPG